MRFAFTLLVLLSSVAQTARATDIPCQAVEAGAISVDGLSDDWKGLDGIEMGNRSADLSFSVKCGYDDGALYFFVAVRDDYLVRTEKARPAEDHLSFIFADGDKLHRLTIYPSDEAAHAPRKVLWSPPRKMSGDALEVADSRLPDGWAVELAIARAQVPGLGEGTPLLRMAVEVADCDAKAKISTEDTLGTSPVGSAKMLGVTHFAEGHAALEKFLAEHHLSGGDITFDQMGHIGRRGPARVIVAGKFLAAIADEYAYIELPIRDRRDLRDVRLVDLAGDGRDAAVVRYVERGTYGERGVLAAFRMTGDGLSRTFGCEVSKREGVHQLESNVSFVRRGKATDIVVEAKPAVGWNADTYREERAGDLVPIPLPWEKDKRARFRFKSDDSYFRAE